MDLLRSMAAAGSDDPVLVAHPRGGRAARRLDPGRPRGAARGGRRLPLDPAAHDRPTAHVQRPLVRRPAAGGGADRGPGRVRGGAARTTGWRSARPTTRRSPTPCRASPPPAGSRSTRSPRRTTRSRACSATWSAGERVRAARHGHPARAARAPAPAAADAPAGRPARRHRRCWSGWAAARDDASGILDALVVRTVLPLVALVLGTAALGSEIDDGTIVYLLIKPIARRWIVFATAVVACGRSPRRSSSRPSS